MKKMKMKFIILLLATLAITIYAGTENTVLSLFANNPLPKNAQNVEKVDEIKNVKTPVFKFNGKNSMIVYPAQEQTPAFSFICWVKPDMDQKGSGPIICKQGWDSSLEIKERRFVMYLYDSSKKRVAVTTKRQKANRWYFVCGVFDGSNLLIYLDGDSRNFVELENPPYNNKGVYIIGSNNPNSQNPKRYKGLLNGARVFSKALSDKEIKSIFKNEKKLYANNE